MQRIVFLVVVGVNPSDDRTFLPDEESIRNLVDELHRREGRVDVLISSHWQSGSLKLRERGSSVGSLRTLD